MIKPFVRRGRPLIIAFALSFSWLQKSMAEVYYVPQSAGVQTLSVVNTAAHEEIFWLQLKSSTSFEEVPYHLPARGSLSLIESDFLKPGLEYSVKTQSSLVQVFRQSFAKTWMHATKQVSPQVLFHLKNMAQKDLTLVIQNQNFIPQKVQIRYLSAQKEFLGQANLSTLDYFQSSSAILTPPTLCQFIEIIGEGRLNAQIFNGKVWLQAEEIQATKVQIPLQKNYFLVANSDRSDSFVVALEEPLWIDQARKLIANPSKNNKILFGRIRLDQNSWNRPLLSTNKTPWSWTVTEVTNFADLGSQACDGSPSLVEEQLPIWLDQERICFWSYRVIQELTAEEVEAGLITKKKLNNEPIFKSKDATK